MGIASDISGEKISAELIGEDWHAALAALAWQLDAGIDEVIGEAPINRYDLPESQPGARAAPAAQAPVPAQSKGPRAAAPPPPDVKPEVIDPAVVARAAAQSAKSLEDLREAVLRFELCDLKKGARNTVFSDGNPAARVLVLGEAPGREEDIEGRPFVGRAGQLLDRMFQAIGLTRQSPDTESALYITNVLYWRPPGNRDPEPDEIAMMKPFVERHIELVDPDVIVAMGNTPLACLTGKTGIMRARGTWGEVLGRPLMPMTHPAYLLRNPAMKREAWADLLAIQSRLRQPPKP